MVYTPGTKIYFNRAGHRLVATVVSFDTATAAYTVTRKDGSLGTVPAKFVL